MSLAWAATLECPSPPAKALNVSMATASSTIASRLARGVEIREILIIAGLYTCAQKLGLWLFIQESCQNQGQLAE